MSSGQRRKSTLPGVDPDRRHAVCGARLEAGDYDHQPIAAILRIADALDLIFSVRFEAIAVRAHTSIRLGDGGGIVP